MTTFRIGTRRSALALAQADEVARGLAEQGHASELVEIVTSGDRGATADASPSGLKGLFVAEIASALLEGEVDVAVHSAKDLPAEEEPGLVIAAVPPRERPFDVLVWREARILERPVVGTSALRRQAQLRYAFPEYELAPMRGNVDTRLAKLEAGEYDGIVLAAAGLSRLGLSPRFRTELSPDVMVPAPGQGALAIQTRIDDEPTREAIGVLDHAESRVRLEAEFTLMRAMGGGCALPLGAYAETRGDDVQLLAVVATPDGGTILRASARAETAAGAARFASEDLLSRGAGKILDAVREEDPA